MNHGDIDMAPPPENTLTLTRLRGGGWILIHDGESQVAFTSAADMIAWLADNVEPMERKPLEPVSMPSVLEAARPAEQVGIWRIFQGGRRE